MARRRRLAGPVDHHRKMVPIEMRRAVTWAKEAHDSVEKNRCTDALNEVMMAAHAHGRRATGP